MWYQAHLPPMTLRQHAAAQSMCCSAGAIVPQHSPQQAHALTLHRCAGPQWGTSQGPQRPPHRGASAAAPPPFSSYRAVARTAAAGPHSGSSCNNSVACVGLGYWPCVRLSLLGCVAVCWQSGLVWSPIVCANSKSASRRPAAAHHEVLLHRWKIGVKRNLIVDMHSYPRYLRNAAIVPEVQLSRSGDADAKAVVYLGKVVVAAATPQRGYRASPVQPMHMK